MKVFRVDDRLYLDDLQIGQRFTSGTHVVDEEQIKAFAHQFDPQPFHLDNEAAKNTLLSGLAASGWHTAAITMRLLVEAPAVQVKPRFETAGFRVFQNFREFPRVVLREVQRRYGLRSSTSWHSSLSVRLFEGHGIFGGRWTSRLWHGRNA